MNIMKKIKSITGSKRNAAIISCVVLLCSIAIIATFHLAQNLKVNTITTGEVKIKLTEPGWNENAGHDMLPGEVITKDPQVTNTGENSACVAISVLGIKEMKDNGFAAGLLNSDKTQLLNQSAEIFCFNDEFTLVDREGNELIEGSDHALTAAEIEAIYQGAAGDKKLYFAYDGALKPGDKTPALFTGIKNASLGRDRNINIIKYFTTNNGKDLYVPVTSKEFLNGTPSKDISGNYIYKYRIKTNSGYLDTIYATYESAEKAMAEMLSESGIYTELKICSAAVQSIKGENKGSWESIDEWFMLLPAEF